MQIITLKPRTDRLAPLQSTSRSNIYHLSSSKKIIKSQLNTVENSTSTCSNATSTNLLKKDNSELHKSIASKQTISNKSESTISELSDAAILRKSMPDIFISNNDLDNLDTENISKSPIMNIKITNVTSLPPEVFESVPDVALHENSIDTSSPSTSKSLEKLVTYIAPPKRIYEEGNLRKKRRSSYIYIMYMMTASNNITFYYIFQQIMLSVIVRKSKEILMKSFGRRIQYN